jgi:hypothetical protein
VLSLVVSYVYLILVQPGSPYDRDYTQKKDEQWHDKLQINLMYTQLLRTILDLLGMIATIAAICRLIKSVN